MMKESKPLELLVYNFLEPYKNSKEGNDFDFTNKNSCYTKIIQLWHYLRIGI